MEDAYENKHVVMNGGALISDTFKISESINYSNLVSFK